MEGTEYIDKAKIIKFITDGLNKEGPDNFGYDGIAILAEIYYMETDPDVVKVVRCKNCKHSEDQGISGLYCNHPDNRNPIYCLPDEFCNCGEPKDSTKKEK